MTFFFFFWYRCVLQYRLLFTLDRGSHLAAYYLSKYRHWDVSSMIIGTSKRSFPSTKHGSCAFENNLIVLSLYEVGQFINALSHEQRSHDQQTDTQILTRRTGNVKVKRI